MSSVSDRLYAQARITPIQPQNRVKSAKKLDSGALEVTLHGGQTYSIAQEDDLFQAFVIYTVLNDATGGAA